MDRLSGKYVKVALKALRWMFALLLFAGLGAGISTLVAVPAVQNANKDKGVLLKQTPSGEDRFVYGKEKTPDSFEEEMEFPPAQLIYQKQERFDQPDDMQPDDGGIMDRADTPRSERRRLQRAVARFLSRWETFDAGGVDDSYRDRLRSVVDPASLDQIASRADSRDQTAIGRATGSKLTLAGARRDANDSMSVLRYSPQNAYVSVSMQVQYTGPSLVWAGRTVLRSYGVVLTRENDTWKVARAAAETMSDLS